MDGRDIWQLFVKGLEGKTLTIRIHKDATVDELINKISRENNIPPETQRVLYTSKQLQYGKGKYLSDYHMQNESNLFVVLRLRGGGNSNSGTSTTGINSSNHDIGNNNTSRANNIGGNNTGDNNTGDNDTDDLFCVLGADDTDDNTGDDETYEQYLLDLLRDDDTEVSNTEDDDTEDHNNPGDYDTLVLYDFSRYRTDRDLFYRLEDDVTNDNNSTDGNTGGNNTALSQPLQNQRQLDEDVETTDARDIISWEDDPNTPRAKMSCGHPITPETLTTYCKSRLSGGKYVFKCPYISPATEYCGKEWSYLEVRRLAVLTLDEQKQFEIKISDNYLRKGMGIQECPKCHSLCKRINKKDKRVVCPLCSAGDGMEYHFCWHCLHKWIGRDTDKCGNADCNGEDKRLKILRECTKKTIVGVPGCPAIRACLTCGMLIEHDTACKHMVCTCGQKFCFICLKPPVDERYQCGRYDSPCEIAAVQTTIPGDN